MMENILRYENNLEEKEEEERRARRARRLLFSSEIDMDALKVRMKIINYVKILISDRCPHCIKFSGMIFRGGLTSLLSSDCILRRALLKEGWDITKLEVPKKYVYARGRFFKVEEGEAWLMRYYSTRQVIENYVYHLKRKFSPDIYRKLVITREFEKEQFNVLVEKIHFINVSEKTHHVKYSFIKSVPAIISPFTNEAIEGIDPDANEDDIRKILFKSSLYDVKRHDKYVKGNLADWEMVLEKNVLHLR